jgi:hypothetical protein
VVARLLALPGATDLDVRDAPLEDVMRDLFAAQGRATAPSTAGP